MAAFAVAAVSGLRQPTDILSREHLGQKLAKVEAAKAASFEVKAASYLFSNKWKKTRGSTSDGKFYDRVNDQSVGQKTSRDFEVAPLSREFNPAPAITLPTTGNSIPMLYFPRSSQNSRVSGFERITTDAPKTANTIDQPRTVAIEEVIYAAYNQIMNVHHLEADRQIELETRVRDGRISVREFVKGLATSPAFLETNFNTNSNYRFAEIAVQRILGRDVYNKKESIAWSIVIANKGVEAFIDALQATEEYKANFGEHTVPFQRQRVLAGRATGAMPFLMKTPRYDADFRNSQHFRGFTYSLSRQSYQPIAKNTSGDPLSWLNVARGVTGNTPNTQSTSQVLQKGWEDKVPRRN